MTTPALAPVLFVSHGAPTFAIEPGLLGPQLRTLGTQLHAIKAVLVVSPHWQTQGVRVSTAQAPETIHDFGGFPSRLYDLQYPVNGAPELATQVAQLLSDAGFATAVDARQGLDHGAWVPLMHLLPEGNLPVFQVSMPYDLTTEQSVLLGRALAPLRAQGVLILASGSMTHNLAEFFGGGREPSPYVLEFSRWIESKLVAGDLDALFNYRAQAPHAQRAHPTDDHFLPLFFALGAAGANARPDYLSREVMYSMLAMDAFALQ